MMTHMRGVGATGLLLLAVLSQPGIANAHGSVSGEDDPCLRRIGEQVVHFNAYQPQYQLREQYCTDIPKEGDTFWSSTLWIRPCATSRSECES